MHTLMHVVSLAPLTLPDHAGALQQVYRATPGYWQMYNLPGSPGGQAARDLEAVAETPGRYMLGIVRQIEPENPATGVEMVGVTDFRLHWPAPEIAYLGMMMVAEPYQRAGIATQAWNLLRPWLADTAKVEKARLGVEQFNTGALQFFQTVGFSLTGESNRIQVGDKWVRLLYMELPLAPPEAATE